MPANLGRIRNREAHSPGAFPRRTVCCAERASPFPTMKCCEFAGRGGLSLVLLRNVVDDVPYKALFPCVDRDEKRTVRKGSNSSCRGRRPDGPQQPPKTTHNPRRIRTRPVGNADPGVPRSSTESTQPVRRIRCPDNLDAPLFLRAFCVRLCGMDDLFDSCGFQMSQKHRLR